MKRILLLIGVGLALLVPGSAWAAGSSTCQAYNDCTTNTQSVSPTTTAAATEPSTATPEGTVDATTAAAAVSSSSLPFTGLDVVLLIAGGGTLLAGGLVVRRLSRRPE